MNIGVITNAFNEERFIPGCIDQFEKFNFDHLVLIPNKPWNARETMWVKDDTENIVVRRNKKVWRDDFSSASEQFNAGLDYFKEKDWVLIVDADERYTQVGIKKLLEEIKNSDDSAIRTNTWSVYWKKTSFEISPKQPFPPIIAVRPSVRFTNIREVNCPSSYAFVPLHHYSYVRTDEEMLKKISTFEASREFQVMDWYNNVWLPWTPAMKNFHPVVPSQFESVVYNPSPHDVVPYLP